MPDDPADLAALRDYIIIKLTLLVGATRMPRIQKKQIEAALEQAILDIEQWKR